jgi:arylformamidase
MKITAIIGKETYVVNLARPHDISIPIRFDGVQLSVFGSPPATSTPLKSGDFVGDVAAGGSCNCDITHFCAHTNGTHTECVGHITREPIFVTEMLQESFFPATLITVTPERADATSEAYEPTPQKNDFLITRSVLYAALVQADAAFLQALVIRTNPNDSGKPTRAYGEAMPPYFTADAIQFLLQQNVQHLIVDIPSIDRLADEGKLTNHHLFWEVPRGGSSASRRTVTELAYIDNAIADGRYVLNLCLAPMLADATPSRPLLYRITDR